MMNIENPGACALSDNYQGNSSEPKCFFDKSVENSFNAREQNYLQRQEMMYPSTEVTPEHNVHPQNTADQIAQNSVGGQSKGKVPINPQKLLDCLSALLNSSGGIKSLEEVQRMAGLMRRYSKKFVSKCIYLNILQATDTPLLDNFYKETGWSLVNDWLSDSLSSRNWPLTEQILWLLLMSPITVERLKMNSIPKLVKEISKECPHERTKGIAEKVVQHWKSILTNIETNSHMLSNVNQKAATPPPSEPVPEEAPPSLPVSQEPEKVITEDPQENFSIAPPTDEVPPSENSIQTPEETPPPVERSPHQPYAFNEEEEGAEELGEEEEIPSPPPPTKRGRKRGRPRGSPRGRGAQRGRRGRGAARGRGAKANPISYAELLNSDIESTEPKAAEQQSDEGAKGPIRITIRSGSKVLAKVSNQRSKNRIASSDESEDELLQNPIRLSDSTDSEDNKPLSIIKRRCRGKGSRISTGIDDDDVVILEDENTESKAEVEDKKEGTEEVKAEVVEGGKGDKEQAKDNTEKDENSAEREDKKEEELDTKPVKKEDSIDKIESKPKKERQDSKDDKDSKKHDKKKEKDSKRDKHKEHSHSSKEKEKEETKDRDKRDRDKDKESHRHRSKDGHKHHSHHHSRHSHRDEKDKKRHSDKRDHKDRDRDKRKDDKERERKKDHDEKEKRVKEILDKIKPLSTEGLSKIPRMSSQEGDATKDASSKSSSKKSAAALSFLDALGSADSDAPEAKRPPVKVKSRGFRNTGLLEETIKPPGVAGKRSGDAKNLPLPPGVKRQNSLVMDGGPSEKRIKPSVSSLPISADRPGGSKLISPKRPALADDGGFMAALAASTPERKKVARKRRSSESDPKEGGVKAPRAADSKDIHDDGSATSKDALAEPLPNKDSDSDPLAGGEGAASEATEGTIVSPTSIKPTLNFYKETLTEKDAEGEQDDKKESPTEEKTSASGSPPPGEEGTPAEGDDETKGPIDKEDEGPPAQQGEETPEKGDAKKEDDNMEIDDSDENALSLEKIPMAPAVPAPTHENYEKVEVTFSGPKVNLKSAILAHHRPTGRKKKAVRWRTEEDLKEVFFFPMDEQERVNVNTVKFQEMMMLEKAKEKEEMLKHRHQMGMGVGFYGQEPFEQPQDNCVEYFPWKLYPIHLPGGTKIEPGCKSKEKHVQAQRELSTMGAFFHPAMRPDTPKEPDPELVQRTEPIVIPLGDVSGQDCITDNREIPWPEPVFNQPSEFPPFMGGSQMPPGPPQANSGGGGGHWVVGSHPAARFTGAPLYGGPNPPQGPVAPGPPGPYGGQGYGGDMRGGWGPPNDYSGPSMMMGPGMMGGGGPGMGGPAGPPNMGPPGMGSGGPGMPGGPNMGMHMMNSEMGRMGGGRGGSGPGRGGGPRYNRRGGGNWMGPPSSKPCQFFMNGHCKNGQNCRFSHDISR